MERLREILLTDLRYLLTDVVADDGIVSPSVYDTAQLVRLYPLESRIWPALEWIMAQQQPDGGWGNPAAPLARDVPTLSALLALQGHSERKTTQQAIRRGLTFLHRQASQWTNPPLEQIPVGIELLLPRLLDEAIDAGLDIQPYPYAAICQLGLQRRSKIAKQHFPSGSPPIHSWEAWGSHPDPEILDGSGGVGHSPAATAAWLRAAAQQDDPSLAEPRRRAHEYLVRAATATRTKINGVVPTVWPINTYEPIFILYLLLMMDLMDHPAIASNVQHLLQHLRATLTPSGFGMSEWFMADGDDTAVGLTVLQSAGDRIDLAILERYRVNDHFCAYAGEYQSSVSVTAHGVHLLALNQADMTDQIEYLLRERRGNGCWTGDKWNSSWLYTTAHVLIALESAGHLEFAPRALKTILAYQNTDGGWGDLGSTMEETAYSIMVLRVLARHDAFQGQIAPALGAARRWMLETYRPWTPTSPAIWIGKEVCRPERIARACEIGALLALLEDER